MFFSVSSLSRNVFGLDATLYFSVPHFSVMAFALAERFEGAACAVAEFNFKGIALSENINHSADLPAPQVVFGQVNCERDGIE